MGRKPKKLQYLIGIDEVGRGPLAGPVTVCAFAILKQDEYLLAATGAKDSKLLSEQKRDRVAHELRHLAKEGRCHFSIVSTEASIIDTQGINYAIYEALVSALEHLKIHPEHADMYLDGGLKAPKSYFRQHTVIKGDRTVPVISCASVLAKVYRDKLMSDYDLVYPGYGFLNHKGYGTPEHYRAIHRQGICDLHRKSFLKGVKIHGIAVA